MKYSVKQVLHCFISLIQRDWYVLLPAAKFVLNSTCSAGAGHRLAFASYGHKPMLPFEHAILSLLDVTVTSIVDYVYAMSKVADQVHSFMASSAASMAETTDQHYEDIAML